MSNELEASKGNWDLDFPTDEEKQSRVDRKRIEWMRFPKPGTYRVRLVGPYVRFLRHQKVFEGERVITHSSYKNEDPAWKAGFYPRETYAIHIFDRTDGKLKILEKGNSIFKAFATYKKVNDINPAGKEAPDFSIDVAWPDGNKFQAKYTVTPLAKIQALTEEEMAMWNSAKAPLNEIYKATTLEKIKEKWDALPDEKKVAPKREESVKKNESQPKEEKVIKEEMADAPAEQEDLFGDTENTNEPF